MKNIRTCRLKEFLTQRKISPKISVNLGMSLVQSDVTQSIIRTACVVKLGEKLDEKRCSSCGLTGYP